MQDENLLISQARTGDRNALNELISFFWHSVYRFISYRTGNPEDAKEITQETFIKVFLALPNYQKTDATFKTYLNHIALNLITDFWRKKRRIPMVVELAEYHQPIAESDQPEAHVLNREMSEAIAGLLKELPADQRRTIELRIITGLPVKDTAIAMGKSDAAIKMLQQRAMKNLRILLQARGIVENHMGR